MKRAKVVVVGGGSVLWVPRLVRDMMLTPSLADAEYVLYDIDPKAAKITAAFLARLNQEIKTPAKIVATNDRTKAFKGADYFVVTISTGGFKSMAHDLAIPDDYGIYATVGDTCGPGGWARSIRNYGAFIELAKAMNKHAPGAMVLNYTNPMTVLTDVLTRACDGPVVGLCHGVFENLEFIVNYYNIKDESKLKASYSGLNHFFWITDIRYGKRNLLKDLTKQIQTKTFAELGQESATDEIGFWSRSDLANELYRLAGVMPYIADRHTCEFMAPYITKKKLMKKYKLSRTTIAWRDARFKAARKDLRKLSKAKEIPAHYLSPTRETAADIIAAHYESRTFVDVGNLPNTGQMPDLPKGTVVETPVKFTKNGFTAVKQKPLPSIAVGLMEPIARSYNMTADACCEGDKELALQALRLDPTCAHLDTADVYEMGERLLKAHKRWITCF